MANHSDPIVPYVLYIPDQRHPWRLADIGRQETHYHTPTTVRVGAGHGETKSQHHVSCLPDEAAWERAQACRADHQAALDALANGLRDLGSYASRLDAAGGIKTAPNPLTPTVIAAPDPDLSDSGYWCRPVPHIERKDVASHTPKMLHITQNGKPWATSHQRDHVVCPTDADWERITALRDAAQAAADRWQALLTELGTYAEALADGRYGSIAREETHDGASPRRHAQEQPAGPSPKDFAYGSLVIWTRADGREILGRVTTNFSDKKLALCVPPDNAIPRYVDAARCRPAEEGPMQAIEAALPPIKRAEGYRIMKAQFADPEAGALLSDELRERAESYVVARRRSGDALLEAMAALAAARAEAQHGEWGIFLRAIGIDDATARAQIRVHEAAQADHEFAERVRTGWLTLTTARELLPAPPEIRAEILTREEPPTQREIKAAKRGALPVLPTKPPALTVNGVPRPGPMHGLPPPTFTAPDDTPIAPPSDAEHIAAIRAFLADARRDGVLYQPATRDQVWQMASAIFDGETFRRIGGEIDQACTRPIKTPIEAGPLKRPRPPQSGDVSAQLAYMTELEIYAGKLEDFIRTTVARLEKDLTRLADRLGDAEYEALSHRIGDARVGDEDAPRDHGGDSR